MGQTQTFSFFFFLQVTLLEQFYKNCKIYKFMNKETEAQGSYVAQLGHDRAGFFNPG